MKVKEKITVTMRGKEITLVPGVDYKNLPKEVTDQLPKARKNVKKSDADK